jgi:hypothetical protein
MASSTNPTRLIGVTQAAALIRTMIRWASSPIMGVSQGGRSSEPPGRRFQSGAWRRISASSDSGSPKLT